MTARLSLIAPEALANPYPLYAELRRQGPVVQVDPGGMWAISGYNEVQFAFKNPQLFSSEGIRRAVEPPWLGRSHPISEALLFRDPPRHTRLRALINRAFGPNVLARQEPRIRALAEECVTRMLERRTVDFVDEFALRIPAEVISNLMGLDASLQRHFQRWANDIVSISALRPEDTERMAQCRGTIEEMERYLGEVLAHRQREPSDDLVSELLRARVDGDALTHGELLGFLFLLLTAGLETTTHLLSSSAQHLMERPEELARMRADPSRLPPFIEEVLRYESPAQSVMRVTTQDVELGGVFLPQGSPVVLLVASACRDERYFPDAERFDPARSGPQNMPFGHGVHFCLGASLARLEARVALEVLLARVARLTPGSQPAERLTSILVRGFRKLPVEVHPA